MCHKSFARFLFALLALRSSHLPRSSMVNARRRPRGSIGTMVLLVNRGISKTHQMGRGLSPLRSSRTPPRQRHDLLTQRKSFMSGSNHKCYRYPAWIPTQCRSVRRRPRYFRGPTLRAKLGLVRRHSSRRWWWLLGYLRQLYVHASPVRRRRCPDRHRRIGEIRIVEGADADEDQMRARLGLAEERRPARRTESSVHLVATVRDTWIVAGLACHGERRGAEAGVDRSAAGADILAVPAPAHTRNNRGRRAFPANSPAEASTCYRHNMLHPTMGALFADPTSESMAPAISRDPRGLPVSPETCA